MNRRLLIIPAAAMMLAACGKRTYYARFNAPDTRGDSTAFLLAWTNSHRGAETPNSVQLTSCAPVHPLPEDSGYEFNVSLTFPDRGPLAHDSSLFESSYTPGSCGEMRNVKAVECGRAKELEFLFTCYAPRRHPGGDRSVYLRADTLARKIPIQSKKGMDLPTCDPGPGKGD